MNKVSYIIIGFFIVFLSILFLVGLSIPALAGSATWNVSYQSGAFDNTIGFPIPPSLWPLYLSIKASGKIEVTSPGNVTSSVNIPTIDDNGFSSVFGLGEAGVYQIKETYTLTISGGWPLDMAQNYTQTDNWEYNNPAPSLALFQLHDMYIDNYSWNVVPSGDTIDIHRVMPSPCRPGATLYVDILILREIQPGERIVDSISLNSDWYKNSSLTPQVDNMPPIITHDCVDYIRSASPITAKVTDNLQVGSVILDFTDVSGRNFQIDMIPTGEPDIYAGYIPINASRGWGEYQIKAKDVVGHEAYYPESPYDIFVDATIFGDVNGDEVVSNYDADLVLQAAAGNDSFTPDQQVSGDVSGDGTISSYDSALIMQYVLGWISSFPVENGGSSSLGIGIMASDVEVSIPGDFTGQPGDNIDIPIDVSNPATLGIVGIDITLTYDPDILTAIEAVTEGASGWAKIAYNVTDGQIIIAMANPSELANAGTFVNVKFSISGTAINGQTSPLTLFNVSLNEGGVSADTTNGVFTIVEPKELHFYPGWNIFSICFDIADTNPSSVLEAIEGNYEVVWAYDAALKEWKGYMPDGSLNSLGAIEPGKGYCIYITSANEVILTITGGQLTGTAIPTPMSQGWNLVGYNSLTEQSPGDALFAIVEQCSAIWTSINSMAGETWLGYNVDNPNILNEINMMGPGNGYWIHVK